ncbi:hypothetical protein [Terricaulis sp.]|uniref:hypothetical protein n=1 Tax=Terricaulis sp. TaxID=2768686 RepID=UPI003784C607
MRFAALATLCLLAACGDNAGKQATATVAAEAPLELTCAAWTSVTGASLEQRFGAANVTEASLPGPEGETYMATVVYPNDPAKRVEIVWRDLEARAVPMSVTVGGDASDWIGARDLRLGAALAEVETANGRPFQLWGFGWDYGGYVSDWKGGALDDPACRVRVRFDPGNDAAGANGDSAFMSDAPAVRAANAHVSEISLGYSHPDQ